MKLTWRQNEGNLLLVAGQGARLEGKDGEQQRNAEGGRKREGVGDGLYEYTKNRPRFQVKSSRSARPPRFACVTARSSLGSVGWLLASREGRSAELIRSRRCGLRELVHPLPQPAFPSGVPGFVNSLAWLGTPSLRASQVNERWTQQELLEVVSKDASLLQMAAAGGVFGLCGVATATIVMMEVQRIHCLALPALPS